MPLIFSRFPSQTKLEAGCDEVGRGCLAGPVVAAAVILKTPIDELQDSKKLSAKKRQTLAARIKNEALTYAIAEASPQEIDQINILQATLLAMHRCLKQLNPQPETLLIDGTEFIPYQNLPHSCIPQGDQKYQSIAAASILAKTYRDKLMDDLHQQLPHYQWNQNKGYPTAHHKNALQTHGLSPQHRKSFKTSPRQ
jgi:ribonuclease HII